MNIAPIGQFWRSRLPRLGATCFAILLALLLGLLPLPGYALTVQEIANPRAGGGWVTDQAQVLSTDAEQQLNQLLTRLEAKTRVEMAVVTVAESLQPLEPRAFGKRLFNTWGIGKAGVNNGVLLLVAVGDRRIEILTGAGMGTRLPDTYLHNLILTQIKPAFQQGQLEEGVMRGVTQITARLTGQEREDAPGAGWGLWLIVGSGTVGLVALGAGYGWVGWLRQQPVVLPPTGCHFQPHGFPIVDLSFDRLVALTPYRAGWPRSPLLLLALGLALVSGALSAIALLLLERTPMADNLYIRLLVIAALSVVSAVCLHPVDLWLKRSPLHWQPMLAGSATYLVLALMVCLPILSSVLALQKVTWETATLADLLRVAPVYLGLWNGAIAAWFAIENGEMLRVPPQYRCQTCGQAIAEITESGRLVKLFPKTLSAAYRGWHCPTCHPTFSPEGVFLITQEPRKYTAAGSGLGFGRDSASTSADVYADTSTITWDTSGSSSGSDFGGGYSDGGGSGDSW